MKKKILLLSGGPSKERAVSINSGKAVYKALKKLDYNVIKIDPNKKFTDYAKYKCNLAFNALHGQFGEDGTIQSYLEKQKIRYTHSGVLASALAMDKVKSKKYLLKKKLTHLNTKLLKKYLNLATLFLMANLF